MTTGWQSGVVRVWIERTKWPDLPHYGHDGWILGEDEHGLWIELRVGTPIYRGEELLFHGTGGGLMLAPPDAGWLAWFPEHGEFELYVDIVTAPVRNETSVTMVDLDFDVVRLRDGEVRLLDEDEFELHKDTLGYPAPLIEAARAGAAEVLAAVRAGHEPFAGATAARWAAIARRRGEAAG